MQQQVESENIISNSGKDTGSAATKDSHAFSEQGNYDSTVAFAGINSANPTGYSALRTQLSDSGFSEPAPKITRNPDWLIISIILIISYLTWIRVFNYKIIRLHFAAIFSNPLTNQIVRDENILVQRTSVLLSIVFYFSLALFLYQMSIFFKWDFQWFSSGLLRYVLFILIIASAYSLKIVILKLLSLVFRIDRAISTYIFNIILINNILGILLVPVLIVSAFLTGADRVMLCSGIMLLAVAFLFRIFRSAVIWRSVPHFTLYYFILYLCAMEIAPLLIIFKLA